MIYQNTAPISPLTLEEIKAHLRISHDSEDTMLNQYALSACNDAEHKMMREIIYRKDPQALAQNVDTVPAGVKQYLLCLIGDMYAHRELSTTSSLSVHFEHLLDPFILYDREDEES